MKVQTPEQLEDAQIADAIRSIVALKTRAQQRELQNKLTEAVQPKLNHARLNGKRVNVDAFIKELLREVANA